MEQFLAGLPQVLLISSRIAGVVAVSPVFANRFIPVQLRVALTLLLAVLVFPAAEVQPGALSGTGFLLSCVLELTVGLLIGFMTQMIFSAVQMAGAIMDVDLGFAMAQMFDPATGRSEPLLSSFMHTLALVIYVSVNGHHWLLRALSQSYDALPAGGVMAMDAGPMYVVSLFGALLATAVKIALPVMMVMMLAYVALAGMSRALPQMHLFALSLGVRTVLGLAFLMLTVPYLPGVLESLFSTGQTELLKLLDLLRP